MPEIKMNLQKQASKTIKLNLQKAGVDEKEIPLMAVFQSIDRSGSMDTLYRNNWVSQLLVVAAGAALTFDDNKSLQVSFFNHDLTDDVPEIDENTNIETYLQDNRIGATGGTSFSEPLTWFNQTDASGYDDNFHIEEVESKSWFKRLFGMKDKVYVADGDAAPEDLPKLLMLITDGQCYTGDQHDTMNQINKFGKNDFLFVIGIGAGFDEHFVKNMCRGDNASYFWIRDCNGVTADDMLKQFTDDTKFVNFIKAHKLSK